MTDPADMARQWFGIDGKTLVIGTHESCDLRLDDDYASGQHAVVWHDTDGTWIADLGSTNGTRIQRTPGGPEEQVHAKAPIQPGVTIIVGRTRIPWSSS